jgi:peptidyl-prolyl cis-trans isomerase D
MLEQLRQNSRSLVVWVLFIIIIAAFVLTFGTQSEVNMSACTGYSSATDVMDVDDGPVSVHSWRFGMNALRGGTSKVLRSQRVLDALLQRELLAQAAAEAGFHVTSDMATEAIRDGKFLVLGMPVDGKVMYYTDGYFDYDKLLAQVNAMGLPTVDQFIAEQQRELQAEVMRDLLLRGSVASPEEARARYIYENTTATVDVVQFRPFEYQRKISLTPEQIDAYRQAHESEVRAKFDADAALYKGRGKELKIRQLHIARKQPAVLKPEGAEASATPAQPEQEDPGLVAARQAHERLVGGADFATLAREISEDERSKDRGGNLGWRSAENPGLGARELAEAVKTLQVGGISDVITTPRGYYILKIDEAREGDLSYEQVARDIAEQMAGEHYAKAAARRDAQAALERARAALGEGKKLDDLFERQQPMQQPGGLEGLEGLPPEILEQLQKQQGSLTFDGPSKPAEASWQGDQQTGTPGDQPAAAPAAGEPAPAGTTGTDTAAVTATGADTATVTATGAADTATTTAAPIEDVPVPADLVKPQVRSVGPFTRDPEGMLTGVGKSEELMNAIFSKLEVNALTDRVYEVSDTFLFLQLVSRQEPNLEDFQKDQNERTQLLGMERGYGNLRSWVQARCEAAVADGKVGLNRELLNQIATEKEGEEFAYQPNCAGL